MSQDFLRFYHSEHTRTRSFTRQIGDWHTLPIEINWENGIAFRIWWKKKSTKTIFNGLSECMRINRNGRDKAAVHVLA